MADLGEMLAAVAVASTLLDAQIDDTRAQISELRSALAAQQRERNVRTRVAAAAAAAALLAGAPARPFVRAADIEALIRDGNIKTRAVDYPANTTGLTWTDTAVTGVVRPLPPAAAVYASSGALSLREAELIYNAFLAIAPVFLVHVEYAACAWKYVESIDRAVHVAVPAVVGPATATLYVRLLEA